MHRAGKPAPIFRRQPGFLAFVVLDIAQAAQDARLFFHVLLFGDVAAFQLHLQFQKLLFQRRIIGVLLLCHLRDGVEDELDAVHRQ